MRVLFVCIHNSARSQMAEAWLRVESKGQFEVESAGIEPGTLNPLVVRSMQEVGIDISGHECKSVDSLIAAGRRFDVVVTVCDESSAERCPVVPGAHERLHWSFDDPSSFTGSDDEKLALIRVIRDAIRARVRDFVHKQNVL